MSELTKISALELGRHLTHVRERAGIKQAELARKVTWSQAVLSRVEGGERPLDVEEFDTLLAAIGTAGAEQLRTAVQRDWKVLPRPSLDHPDQNLLWEAEQVAQDLLRRSADPNIRTAFERRLTSLADEIRGMVALLLRRDHHVAFIGPIGVGKSTAVCRITGLEVPDEKGGAPAPVLEAGAGGITICEVHLRSGPGYGILIEPRTDEEIRADVTDFADYLLNDRDDGEFPDREDAQQGISKEIERAIRNMSGLKIKREKGRDGKRVVRDEAKELANDVSSSRELVVEILSRMNLPHRDSRDTWHAPAAGKPPLVWLKDTFEQINNGRHPEFTLPRRIEVIVPDISLGVDGFSVRLIDTKGIDRTAARADLEGHFDDPHTVAVLCSTFNNAPAGEARLLLERAGAAGVRSLKTNAALLVLPRADEALAVKDESGLRVENAEDGYDLKGEQVAMSLQPMGLADLAVEFFNAHQDPAERLRSFLASRLQAIRRAMCERLTIVTASARSILENYEREQANEVVRHASSILRGWATQNAPLRPLMGHVHDSLMEEMRRAYAATVRASVRREGEWGNLSYTHHLGYGARRIAAQALGRAVEDFSGVCRTLVGNPDFKEAEDLIGQADRVLGASYSELLRKIQIMGQTVFRQELKTDVAFWVECDSEWGQGPGYKNRVAARNENWFTAPERLGLEEQLRALIEREWQAALSELKSLFEEEAAVC